MIFFSKFNHIGMCLKIRIFLRFSFKARQNGQFLTKIAKNIYFGAHKRLINERPARKMFSNFVHIYLIFGHKPIVKFLNKAYCPFKSV